MADWNAELYRKFENERTRPARELLARTTLDAPKYVVDLGCGPGNSTELLFEKYPVATILGLDNSENMLVSARERLPGCRFANADIANWRPENPPDLIYANASLQWVPDHEQLFPQLFAELAPGGVLAVQMPDNFDEPTHRLMRETAMAGPWAVLIGDAAATRVKRLPLTRYYDLLAANAVEVDIWRTTFYHPMDSANAIVNWVRATGLKPFIEPLLASQQALFLAEYEKRLSEAYPAHSDGKLLLAFPRMFIVARCKD